MQILGYCNLNTLQVCRQQLISIPATQHRLLSHSSTRPPPTESPPTSTPAAASRLCRTPASLQVILSLLARAGPAESKHDVGRVRQPRPEMMAIGSETGSLGMLGVLSGMTLSAGRAGPWVGVLSLVRPWGFFLFRWGIGGATTLAFVVPVIKQNPGPDSVFKN